MVNCIKSSVNGVLFNKYGVYLGCVESNSICFTYVYK